MAEVDIRGSVPPACCTGSSCVVAGVTNNMTLETKLIKHESVYALSSYLPTLLQPPNTQGTQLVVAQAQTLLFWIL